MPAPGEPERGGTSENKMKINAVSNFKETALTESELRTEAPSIFASGPMRGVSESYTFVPTARIVDGLREHDWVPVKAEEQRIRKEARRGFQKHMLRFRRAEQMRTLDEWSVELVLLNSHDRGCAYQLHAGIYRRICSNGLVVSEGSFEAVRFRHSKLETAEVVHASFRLLDFVPKVGEMVNQFRQRLLKPSESLDLARHAVLLRYEKPDASPISPETLLHARRDEDSGSDLWTTLNRIQENLIRGGISDSKRDARGRIRSVRAIHGIDSKVSLNKALWGLAEQLANGRTLETASAVSLN